MNVRKIILAPGAAKYLGWAEKKLAAIEALRANNNLPSLSKALIVGGFHVLIKTDGVFGKIILWGGQFPHILFANEQNSFNYNYFTDTIGLASDAYLGTLSPGFDGACLFSGINHNTYRDRWTKGPITGGVPASFVGGVNNFELAIYEVGSELYGVHDNIWRPLGVAGDFPGQHTVDPFFVQVAKASTFGQAQNWLLIDSIEKHYLDLQQQAMAKQFTWVPSFWYAEPMSGIYATGWFYGLRMGWNEGDPFYGIQSGKAQFVGFMNLKGRWDYSRYRFGWCECLIEMTDEPVCILSFFAAAGPPGLSADPWFNWITTSDADHTLMRGGTYMTGFQRVFAVGDPFEDGTVPTIDWWAFEAWYNPDEVLVGENDTPDCMAVVLISGTRAKFLRWKSYTDEFFTTDSYHSHSVSTDGTILAVFESTDGVLITTVRVFDLYGTKREVTYENTLDTKSPSELWAGDAADVPEDRMYYRGGVTEIRVDSSKILAKEVYTGCLIPHRKTDFSPLVLPAVQAVNAEQATSDYYPAMGSLAWTGAGQEPGLAIHKLTVDNLGGTLVGEARSYLDECFESRVIIDDPRNPAGTDRVVIEWLDDPELGVGLYNGLVRGTFERTGDSMRFWGAGTGQEITQQELYIAPDGLTFTISALNALGELTYGPGIMTNEAGLSVFDPPNFIYTCNPEPSVLFTATTTCGQSATASMLATPFYATFSGGEDAQVGDTIAAGGGVAPYLYEFDSGGIDSEGEITSINACSAPGEARIGTLTVTDSCGATFSFEVRLPGGTWRVIETLGDNTYYDDIGAVIGRIETCDGAGAWNITWNGFGISSYGQIINAVIGRYRYTLRVRIKSTEGCAQSGATECYARNGPSGHLFTNSVPGNYGIVDSYSGYTFTTYWCWATTWVAYISYKRTEEWQCP